MIPWLLVTQIICESGKSLSALVDERIKLFPASGEINRKLAGREGCHPAHAERYKPKAQSVDFTDGLSMEFDSWRFNLRTLEHRAAGAAQRRVARRRGLMKAKTEELLKALEG